MESPLSPERDLYPALKEELLQTGRQLRAWVNEAGSMPGKPASLFEDWEKTLVRMESQVSEEILRVAVVGAIKSGKSTFINSMLQGDYLKRGAGVVTSIVTRIRRGDCLQATLFFKSWEEINADIEQAVALIPGWKPQEGKPDIRRKGDRGEIGRLLKSLDRDVRFAEGEKSSGILLLESYLRGYDRVREIIGPDGGRRVFGDEEFARHRDFTGNDAMAAYLRDIELTIDSESLARHMEIADCQGSDSPNPLHLAMIQDYLLSTHLIVYVISSRTGVRKADLQFLSIIRKMGISENILFVVNADFNEHESPESLTALSERVGDDLGRILPDPEIYTLSALFNLFRAAEEGLSEKDRHRLERWKTETDFADLSDRGTQCFRNAFRYRLTSERPFLLLKNQVERIEMMGGAMARWLSTSRELLNRDAAGAAELLAKINAHGNRMADIRSVLKSTLAGGVQAIKEELRKETDRFFDPRSGAAVRELIDFIRNHPISFDGAGDGNGESGFSEILHRLFLSLKGEVDRFMVESLYPEAVGFIKQQETRTSDYFRSLTRPYLSMAAEALDEERRALEAFGIAWECEGPEKKGFPVLDVVRGDAQVFIPPAIETVRYSARLRTEAFFRLGVHSLSGLVRRLWKKAVPGRKNEKELALRDAVSRMKKELEKAALFHIRDYQENIKFQYLFKLVEALSARLLKDISGRFRAEAADLTRTGELAGEKQKDRESLNLMFVELDHGLKEIRGRTGGLGEKMEREMDFIRFLPGKAEDCWSPRKYC